MLTTYTVDCFTRNTPLFFSLSLCFRVKGHTSRSRHVQVLAERGPHQGCLAARLHRMCSMEACRIVTSLFGSDAIFAPRANTGLKNNGRPHGPLFKNLHRPVFSHNNQPNHFPHSFTGPAHLRTLPPQLRTYGSDLQTLRFRKAR